MAGTAALYRPSDARTRYESRIHTIFDQVKAS